MIIGNINLSDLVGDITKIEKTLGREVNPTILSKKEFFDRIKKNETFITTVWNDKKIFLKGDEVEFKALVR